MEIGEREPRICRLCGQWECIYLDVFSEEGVKRLLDHKIQTKVNVLIEENDGLPHTVCFRCVGFVDFVCTFQDECNLIQEKLLEAVSYSSENERKIEEENEMESNKENVASSTKRKARPLAFDNSKGKKNCLTEKNVPHRKNKAREDIGAYKNDCVDAKWLDVESKNADFNGKILKDLSNERSSINKGPKVSRSEIKLQHENKDNVELAVQRSKVKKRRETKKEVQNDVDKRDNFNSKCNIKWVHTVISSNDKSSMRNKAVISKVLQVEDETDTLYKNDTIVEKSEGGISSEKTNALDNSLENSDYNSARAVKGKIENPMSSIPSEVLENENIDNVTLDLSPSSPLLEKNKTESKETDFEQNETKNSSDRSSPKPEAASVQQNRATVIKSSRCDEVSSSNMVQHQQQQQQKDSSMDRSRKNSLFLQSSDTDDTDYIKRKPGKKVTDLMTDEQKKIIETYYRVDMSAVNTEEVTKHIIVIDKKNIRCNICGLNYFRMDKCQVHIWGHLNMKPFQCRVCDFVTVTVSNVRCHIRKSHLKIKPFKCNFCHKCYTSAILLEDHHNIHTGARPYKCQTCGFATSSKQILSDHYAVHKPTKEFGCDLCSKRFYTKNRLRSHMIMHNKDEAFMCKLCSNYLSSPEALQKHHTRVHLQDYVCNTCNKAFRSRKALHNHQNVHSAGKYKCKLCPNVYKSSQILKEHLLKHKGIRSYRCNVCGKSFGQQSHLAAHMAVHSEIRFKCPGCDRPFNRQDNMKMHTKRCKQFLANPELKHFLIKKKTE